MILSYQLQYSVKNFVLKENMYIYVCVLLLIIVLLFYIKEAEPNFIGDNIWKC